jgi:hypothetical protein
MVPIAIFAAPGKRNSPPPIFGMLYDREQISNSGLPMEPLYAARIQDLGHGDFVKVECIACGHVELLSPDTLRIKGLPTAAIHSGARFGTAAPLPRMRREGKGGRVDQTSRSAGR